MNSRFMKRTLVYGSPIACIALFACYDAPVETPTPTTTQETKVRVAQNTKNKVDILFMIDNSPSMAPKQDELKQRFPQLIQILDSFKDTSPADYHIGVVTSDLGAGPNNINGNQCHPAPAGSPPGTLGGDNGRLQAKGAAAATSCLPPTGGVNFIEYNQLTLDSMGSAASNLPAGQDLATTFSCMASVGDTGCGFEAQLESVYHALHDNVPENHDFLRSDALLVVVWVTDEDDDCSADPNTDLYSTTMTAAPPAGYGALLSFRGTQYGVACDAPGSSMGPAQMLPYGDSGGPLSGCQPMTQAMGGKCYDINRYINYFTQPSANGGVKTDPNDVILVSITAPETPFSTILANIKAAPGPYQTCAGPPDGTNCAVVLQHSCIAAENTQFFGDPAVRIRAVVNSVKNPMNKANTEICDTSYQQALQNLGQIIVSNIGSGCITSPLDNPQMPDCVVEDVTDNADGTTSVIEIPWCGGPPGVVPAGQTDPPLPAGATVPCWQLVVHDGSDGKKACSPVYKPGDTTAQQYGMTVQYGAAGPPDNATAQVSCSTIAVPPADM